MKNFIQISIVILVTFGTVGCRSFLCPYLIRPNNWEIEKFFGTWNAIESFSHTENENITGGDICLSLHINEVNELHEPMSYGMTADPFNFRYAHRYLEINFSNTTNFFTHYITFNNTKQMLWKGNDIVMQIIKFDGIQMMTTICLPKEELLFTILLDRRNYEEIAGDSATKFNHLILKGRNLKVHSNFLCKSEFADSSGASKLNLTSMKILAVFHILILLAMADVLLS